MHIALTATWEWSMIAAVFVMSTITHRLFLGCVTLTSY